MTKEQLIEQIVSMEISGGCLGVQEFLKHLRT
jgi:hypothetical protein